jgi:hypothetical protein
MATAQQIIPVVLVGFAAFLALLNWGWFLVGVRNKSLGESSRPSTVPVVSLILVILSNSIRSENWPEIVWIIPCADIGNLRLLVLPFKKFDE